MPTVGLSHFLTLLAVAASTARLGGTGVWLRSISFLVGIVPGFVFAIIGVADPLFDLAVGGVLLVSLVQLAVAVVQRVRLATRDGVTTMLVLGGFHGHPLGTEPS